MQAGSFVFLSEFWQGFGTAAIKECDERVSGRNCQKVPSREGERRSGCDYEKDSIATDKGRIHVVKLVCCKQSHSLACPVSFFAIYNGLNLTMRKCIFDTIIKIYLPLV